VEDTLDRLIGAWVEGRQGPETFRDFCIRTSDEDLAAIAAGTVTANTGGEAA
jgi:hypothetical protein